MTDFNPSHTVTFRRLLGGGGELGDGLGSLTDGVLGKLPRKLKADSGLDLATLKGGLLVVLGELSSLSTDAVEDVVDERVHHGHSLLGDSGVGVDLLEDLVDVGGVTLGPLLGPLGSGSLLGALCGFLGRSLGHFDTALEERPEDVCVSALRLNLWQGGGVKSFGIKRQKMEEAFEVKSLIKTKTNTSSRQYDRWEHNDGVFFITVYLHLV